MMGLFLIDNRAGLYAPRRAWLEEYVDLEERELGAALFAALDGEHMSIDAAWIKEVSER